MSVSSVSFKLSVPISNKMGSRDPAPSLRVTSSKSVRSGTVLIVLISVLGVLNGVGAFPTGLEDTERTEEQPVAAAELVNYTRVEREIDLRQNLHKHLKPYVAIHSSSVRRPKPIDTVLVEKPASPYFVRILKRRPGGISKESLEELDSTEVPKVLIDRRRNKESPILPVVVIDSNGVPQRNRTVLVEKSQEEREAAEFQEALEKDDYKDSYANFNPSAGALQSLPEFTPEVSFSPPTTTELPFIEPTTKATTTSTASPETSESPVEVSSSTLPSVELFSPSTTSSPLLLVREIPSSSTFPPPILQEMIPTEQQSIDVPKDSSELPPIDSGIIPSTFPTTTEIPTVNKESESFLPLKITENSTPSEESIPAQSAPSTTEAPQQQIYSDIPGFILGPELGLQGPISAEGHTFPNPPEPEFISTNLNGFNPSFPHQTIVPVSNESEFPVIESLHSSSTSSTPPPSLESHSTSSPSPTSTLDDLDSASSSSSFSTLAVTKVLPNTLSKRTTQIGQQDEAMQASEIFTQSVAPSTTPLSVTTTSTTTTTTSSTTTPTTTTPTTTTTTPPPPPSSTTSEPEQISSRRIDDIQSASTTPEALTTNKPSTIPPTSSASTISNEQLQHLMKAAIARLLLQQQQQKQKQDSPNQNALLPGSSSFSNFPTAKLIESKPTRAEEVYLNPSSFPRSNDLIQNFNNNKPTSPMPSLLNALQKLINVTPRPTVPPPSFVNPNQNNNGLFSNPLFAGLFPTTTKAPSIFDIFRNPRSSTTNAPFFFINLRTTEPSRQTSQSELITTKIPILASVPSWHEFTGREVQPHFQQQQQQQQQSNNKQSSPGFQLGTILMAPVNLVMGMVKGMFSIGQFMGNTINTLASAFSPNKSNRL